MDGFLKKVLIGSGATLVSMLVVKVMAIVNSVIAARLLQPEDFGALSIIVNLQNLVAIVACFGIPLAMTKHVSQWRARDEPHASAIGSALLLMLTISAAVTAAAYLLLSGTIAEGIYSDPGLVDTLRLSSVFVLVSSINLGLVALLQGGQRITTLAKINALVAVLNQPITFVSVSVWGLEGAVLALVAANMVSIAFLLVSLRQVIRLSMKGARRILGQRHSMRPLISFTIPSFLISLMIVPAYWIGRTQLALDWSLEAVGDFQIAESLSQIVLLVPHAVTVPLLPLIAEQQDMGTVGKHSGSLLRLAVFLGLPFSIAALPFLRALISILYGDVYEPANDTAILMFASSTFIALGSVISSTIIGTGRMWAVLVLNAVWLALFLGAVFTLVPSSGSEGLAGAYVVSYLIYLFSLMWYFRAKFNVNTSRLVPLIAAFVPAMALYLAEIKDLDFWVRLGYGFGLAALFLIMGFRFVLEEEERGYLRQFVTSIRTRRPPPSSL